MNNFHSASLENSAWSRYQAHQDETPRTNTCLLSWTLTFCSQSLKSPTTSLPSSLPSPS